MTGQVGDRLGRRRAFNQFAEAGSLVVVGDAVKPGIQFDPSALEYVGEEDFGAEAGVVHSFLSQEFTGRGKEALDGPRRCDIGRRRHERNLAGRNVEANKTAAWGLGAERNGSAVATTTGAWGIRV
ncbi:MAG: hypothetical protein BroJett003_12480 [Planctomycetota bacterium]|nr:MAG: hypothetical protein BroJett003_12480 [Planctomycetota bacterium]